MDSILHIKANYMDRFYPLVRVEAFEGTKAAPLNQSALPEWHYVYVMKSDLARGEEGETAEARAIREEQAGLRERVELLIKAACWNKYGKEGDEGMRNA